MSHRMLSRSTADPSFAGIRWSIVTKILISWMITLQLLPIMKTPVNNALVEDSIEFWAAIDQGHRDLYTFLCMISGNLQDFKFWQVSVVWSIHRVRLRLRCLSARHAIVGYCVISFNPFCYLAQQPFSQLYQFHLPLACRPQLMSREFQILKSIAQRGKIDHKYDNI
jgi:hypothetical protein